MRFLDERPRAASVLLQDYVGKLSELGPWRPKTRAQDQGAWR